MPTRTPIILWVISISGVLLIMAILTGLMYWFTRPPLPDQIRFAERQKYLDDLNAQAQDRLNHFSLINPAKNVVRLPINRAMEITIQEWENPGQARSNLLERLNNLLSTNSPGKSIVQ